jgi:putative redox protein
LQVSVKLTKLEGLRFDGEMEDGRRISLNSTEEMGQAFTPMELFLFALAGCTAMDVQWIMERQRQKVDKMEVSANGNRRDEDPKYYESIDLEYVLSGPGIRKEAVERAIRLSSEKYCSVKAMLKETIKVNTAYRIEGDIEPQHKSAAGQRTS